MVQKAHLHWSCLQNTSLTHLPQLSTSILGHGGTLSCQGYCSTPTGAGPRIVNLLSSPTTHYKERTLHPRWLCTVELMNRRSPHRVGNSSSMNSMMPIHMHEGPSRCMCGGHTWTVTSRTQSRHATSAKLVSLIHHRHHCPLDHGQDCTLTMLAQYMGRCASSLLTHIPYGLRQLLFLQPPQLLPLNYSVLLLLVLSSHLQWLRTMHITSSVRSFFKQWHPSSYLSSLSSSIQRPSEACSPDH